MHLATQYSLIVQVFDGFFQAFIVAVSLDLNFSSLPSGMGPTCKKAK